MNELWHFKHITRLKEDISELAGTVRRQKDDLQKYAIYQQFMEKVLDSSPEVSRYVPRYPQ